MSVLRLIGRIILYSLAGIGTISAAVIFGVVMFFFLGREEPPQLDRIVLTVDLGREIVERDRPDLLEALAKRRPLVLHDAIDAIHSASADGRVAGLVLDIGNAPINLTDAQAIRRAVTAFRETGKFAYAFAESYGGLANGTVAYYLATSAEEIWMQPSGTLGLVGMAIEAPFMAGTLEKLDVMARHEKRHEYKGAGEMFMRSGFSPEARASLDSLLNSWMEQIVSQIAYARDLSSVRVRKLINTGPHLAKEAKEASLIDTLAYRDELKNTTIKQAGSSAVWLSVRGYLGIAPVDAPGERTVALIYGEGAIIPGRDGGTPVGKARRFAADTVADAILDAAMDNTVAAILLRIDSPGGSYGASDTVWRAIQVAKRQGKPVVASLGRTAASGGYYVAMAADRIVAEAATITGSIGVLKVKFVTRDLWRKLGVEWDRVQVGSRAAIGSMIDDYPPGGAERVSSFLDAIYADFTSKVAIARDLDAREIDMVARGRIWSGAAAKKVGLIDEIGGLEASFAELRKLLNIKVDTSLDIVEFPRRSRLEEFVAALQSKGFEIGAFGVPLIGGIFSSPPGLLSDMVRQLDTFEVAAGVLQMPAWRVMH